MTAVATQYGYEHGGGVHQVVKRLAWKPRSDRALSAHLPALARAVSSAES